MDEVQHVKGTTASLGDHCTFGILTISDRASTQEYEDKGGPAIYEFFEQSLLSSATVHYRCIPDEQNEIEHTLIELADGLGDKIQSSSKLIKESDEFYNRK